MKIFVDENIPKQTADYLNSTGHNVLDIRKTNQEGLSDGAVGSIAQNEQRLVITTDRGFLANRQDNHYGILVILLRQPNSKKIHDKVVHAIQHYKEEDWPGMTVVMRDRVMTMWKRKANQTE